jgi:hypothetical protein
MVAHTKEQREFIVRRLAGFESPPDIAESFVARWRTTACDLPDILALDPARNLIDPDLQALWQAERARVIADPSLSPTADKRVRLLELHRMFEKARNRNLLDQASNLLAQIGVEVGDLSGKGGPGAGPSGPAGGPPISAIELIVVDPKPLPEESS